MARGICAPGNCDSKSSHSQTNTVQDFTDSLTLRATRRIFFARRMSPLSADVMASAAWVALAVVCAAMLILSFDYLRECGCFSRRQPVKGSLVVLTGAAGGLGRALALELASRGAVLALWDLRADALNELVEWLVHDHGVPKASLHAKVIDVTNANAVTEAAAELSARLGPPRVVVSNAAVVIGQTVLQTDFEVLRASFDVNVLAHFWLAKAFLPQLLADLQVESTFVTMGSLMADLPAARLADYSASKAATAQLHECLRWELHAANRDVTASSRVRCLHVQPYMVDTRDSPLFAGGTPVKYAWLRPLVPPLRASTVARRMALAIEAGGVHGVERIVLPYIFKWLAPTLSWLPSFIRDLLLDIAGAGCAMDAFAGLRAECLPREAVMGRNAQQRRQKSPARHTRSVARCK